jgi:hypothetical protein
VDGFWSYPRTDRAAVAALLLSVVATIRAFYLVVGHTPSDSTVAYWTSHLAPGFYDAHAYTFAAHEYPPIVAQLLGPLTQLSFPAFQAVWLAVQIGLLLWLVGPRWLGIALLLPPVLAWVANGNIQNFYVLTAGLGLRYPALWAIPILSKVTPGIGLLWFVVRREWRSAAIALGTTAALVLVSLMTVPWAWAEWLAFLTRSGAAPDAALALPLSLRLAAAAALTVWGARTNRPWVLAIVLWLAMPTAWWIALVGVAAVLLRDGPPDNDAIGMVCGVRPEGVDGVERAARRGDRLGVEVV